MGTRNTFALINTYYHYPRLNTEPGGLRGDDGCRVTSRAVACRQFRAILAHSAPPARDARCGPACRSRYFRIGIGGGLSFHFCQQRIARACAKAPPDGHMGPYGYFLRFLRLFLMVIWIELDGHMDGS